MSGPGKGRHHVGFRNGAETPERESYLPTSEAGGTLKGGGRYARLFCIISSNFVLIK